MNGRIYDPLLGRFLSADLVVQDPSDLQSYNRYSYVKNNPLTLTDPTGFFWKELWEKLKKLAGSGSSNEQRTNDSAPATQPQSTVPAAPATPPTTLPNGNTAQQNADGSLTITHPDGTSQTYTAEDLNQIAAELAVMAAAQRADSGNNTDPTLNSENILSNGAAQLGDAALNIAPGYRSFENSWNSFSRGDYLSGAEWGAGSLFEMAVGIFTLNQANSMLTPGRAIASREIQAANTGVNKLTSIRKLTGASDATLGRVASALNRIASGRGSELTKNLIELSKTPAGRAQIAEMHAAVSRMIPCAASARAANVMKTLQDLTLTLSGK